MGALCRGMMVATLLVCPGIAAQGTERDYSELRVFDLTLSVEVATYTGNLALTESAPGAAMDSNFHGFGIGWSIEGPVVSGHCFMHAAPRRIELQGEQARLGQYTVGGGVGWNVLRHDVLTVAPQLGGFFIDSGLKHCGPQHCWDGERTGWGIDVSAKMQLLTGYTTQYSGWALSTTLGYRVDLSSSTWDGRAGDRDIGEVRFDSTGPFVRVAFGIWMTQLDTERLDPFVLPDGSAAPQGGGR